VKGRQGPSLGAFSVFKIPRCLSACNAQAVLRLGSSFQEDINMKKTIIMLIVGYMMTASVTGYASDSAASGPQAFLSEGIYEFQPVVEGTHIVHDFILQNRGDEILEIVKIESG